MPGKLWATQAPEKLWATQAPEIIDNENEKINKTLEKKEDLIALWILEAIDIQIPNHDIDLSVDRKNDKFYFISWDKALNIPLDLKNLPKIWRILVELFNNNIQLSWDLTWRSINADTMMPNWLEKSFINSQDNIFTKNDIEELFIFTMKTKNINIEDWEVENTVCADANVNNECKQALWK